jgi:hypothetical protein
MLWIGVAPATFLKPSEEALATTLTEYRQRLSGPEVQQATLRPPRAALPEAGPPPAPAAEVRPAGTAAQLRPSNQAIRAGSEREGAR